MKNISKVDMSMLDSADKIYRSLDDNGVCTSLYSAEINGDCIGITARLEDKGFIRIIDHPDRRGHAYEWLHGQLRPYQGFMENLIMENKAAFLIAALPTGTGKTRLSQSLIQNYKKTLFVTPRINLTHQTHSVFGEELNVGIMQGSKSKNLSAPHIVANLQTLENRLDTLPEFDLVIFDEVHYSFDRIKSLSTRIKSKKFVGITATPYFPDGTPLEGQIVEPFDIQYFMDRDYLAPLRCMQTVSVDDTRLKLSKKSGDFTQKSLDELSRDNFLNQSIIVATKNAIKGQTIIFASNIEHCEKLAAGYQDAGFTALTMHSKVDDPQAALQAFKNKDAQLLVTVNQVTFGTDVPDVETGVVARPIGSKSLWRQIIGRLLRPAPGKHEALLLDCGGNLKRLGNPLAAAKPPTKYKKPEISKCLQCDYPRAPYIKSFRQDFNMITRLYRCSACGNEEEKQLEVETIQCEKCNRFHLTTDVVIHDECEVINCDCGHTIIVKRLDDVQLVISGDGLLGATVAHYLSQHKHESELIAATAISNFLLTEVRDNPQNREAILTRLIDHSMEDSVDWIKYQKKKAAEQAQKAPECFEDDPEVVAVIKIISETNYRYQSRNRPTLCSEEIAIIVNDYKKCKRPNKAKAFRTRLHNIEQKQEPIKHITSFIPYISKQYDNS